MSKESMKEIKDMYKKTNPDKPIPDIPTDNEIVGMLQDTAAVLYDELDSRKTMIGMKKEKYEAEFDYLDNYSYWSHVDDQIEYLKFEMALLKHKVNEAHTTKERFDLMKEIMKLVSWGFEPNF